MVIACINEMVILKGFSIKKLTVSFCLGQQDCCKVGFLCISLHINSPECKYFLKLRNVKDHSKVIKILTAKWMTPY